MANSSPLVMQQQKQLQSCFGAVVQLAFNKGTTNPANQAAAVTARRNDANSRHRFNVATVTINSVAGAHTQTKKSAAAGPNHHAERRALFHAMDAAGIGEGHSNNNGTTTGGALHGGEFTSINVYSEFPICDRCDPYYQNIHDSITGNIDFNWSEELDDWYDLSGLQKRTAFNNHLEAVLPEEDEEELPDVHDAVAVPLAIARALPLPGINGKRHPEVELKQRPKKNRRKGGMNASKAAMKPYKPPRRRDGGGDGGAGAGGGIGVV